jgi:hypothetical protein
MAATDAARNRKVRQEALRDQLSNKGLVQKVLDNITKMEEQGASMEGQELQALKAANEGRLKLINKYLPDLKAMELTGDPDSPLEFKHALFEFVPVSSND